MFSCEVYEIFKDTFFTEQPRAPVAASDLSCEYSNIFVSLLECFNSYCKDKILILANITSLK